ncbi:MAG: hydantoinase/oxoprolinase family protein [Methanomethylovorans sp.]|uniref:hydantoinase/oxoprolinase family protein n=1 Tax=Methanomethylovorans sp. TaxID=2758717 RepID=UPI001BD244A8
MQYGLGMDVGGTYTDAVIIREGDEQIVDYAKSPTTHPDLLTGIQNVLDSLSTSYLENVTTVSISTTLVTNTILENNVSEKASAYNVALIMVGDTDLPPNSSIPYSITVQGGHNANGNENYPLEKDKVKKFVIDTKDKVDAYAVSAHFSIRNPDHELKVKEIIEELTDLPVVCGHELSQSLGSYERGVTACLNAQLVPISTRFMNTVVSEIKRRGINAKIMMLKCDGSVVSIQEALRHPIESIFTGPAASLVGASYLSKKMNCIAIDVGGTSTDVAKVTDGIPEIIDEGAVVGGWQTKVKAIRMETSAMGGDSHIWIKNQEINIGPRRAIPISAASAKWPILKEKLKKKNIPSKMQLCKTIQPTIFFIRTDVIPDGLSKTEEELLSRIDDEPRSINELYPDSLPSPIFLDLLIEKKLVQAIGFTPTDALHVLGHYTEWDQEAARIAADVLGKMMLSESTVLCKKIKKMFAENMASYTMAYLLKGIDKGEIKRIIANKDEYLSKFKVGVTVVLLGGPVRAYLDDMKEMIETEIILPEYAEVGNAVGAIVGKVIKRVEILIRKIHEDDNVTVMMFSPNGRKRCLSYMHALEEAEKEGRQLLLQYLNNSGFSADDFKIESIRQDIKINENDTFPLETKIVFICQEIKKNGSYE